tara:strand:+ start:66 stop:773 length:708 start_codon:yes stop_codon:yes gene_type:complete
MIKQNKIILALDTNNLKKAITLVTTIEEDIIFKIGMEFFFSFGYEGILKIKTIRPNIKIFLDLKLHDIPNTVSNSIIPLIQRIKPFMVTLHATGGTEMMKGVVKSVRGNFIKKERPLLLGVTILTSLDSYALTELGWAKDVQKNVIRYALLCKNCGLDGIVCSALEIENVRKACGSNFSIITPGIRLNKNIKNDQKRVMTPLEAFQRGSDFIVIGRPVMNSKHPSEEIKKILNLK